LLQAEQQFTQDLGFRQQTLAQSQAQFTSELAQRTAQMAQQGQQFTLEQALREKLGLGGLDIQRQQATADTALAQNQFLLQLAQALGGLSPEQMKKLFPSGVPTLNPITPTPPPPGYNPVTPPEPIPLPGTPTTPPPTGTPRWDGEKYVYA
jgi:hypothetical protein